MKRSMIVAMSVMAMMLLTCAAANAGTYTWNFETATDYYVDGDSGTPPANTSYLPVITVDVGAYVPARPWINSDDDAYGSDWASVFARINTQAYHLKVGDIDGGGFTVSGMNHPDAVYGSLYLSPTGGSGSTVMINMSPMGRTGAEGDFIYTFDLDTAADVKIKNGEDGKWGTALTTGTFGGAIDYIEASDDYSDTYAAFFGPQIGMSNTSETTFTVSQIQLTPEPATMALLAAGGIATLLRRRRSSKK
ncbi:MAG: PEP-CTERM sorting domain-containing protein [Planctomycetota bacterium]|nr:PEP-CTERM sorting domain-containing protein [Planctomycetota bacterium]